MPLKRIQVVCGTKKEKGAGGYFTPLSFLTTISDSHVGWATRRCLVILFRIWLLDNGLILLKQLITYDARELGKKTKIRKDLIGLAIKQAQDILSNS